MTSLMKNPQDAIFQTFKVILGRFPEIEAQQGFSAAFEEGKTLLEITYSIAFSPERRQKGGIVADVLREIYSVYGEEAKKSNEWVYYAHRAFDKITDVDGDKSYDNVTISHDKNYALITYKSNNSMFVLKVLPLTEARADLLEIKQNDKTIILRPLTHRRQGVVEFAYRSELKEKIHVGIKFGSKVDTIDLTIPADNFTDIQDSPQVAVVGRFAASHGIASQGRSFLNCLSESNLDVAAVITRPEEGDWKGGTGFRSALPGEIKFSDISIYCDVIANSDKDQNFELAPTSLVSFCVPIFDSTRVPNYWIPRIASFDAALVAHSCMEETLKRSGVNKPIFRLPIATDFTKLDRKDSSYRSELKSDDFTFGCVAGFGERKNITGLIDAFAKIFGNQSGIRLHVHSSLAFGEQYNALFNAVKDRNLNNVFLSHLELSELQYAALLDSFDVFIQVSKGEGWSIPVREAFYLGKPCIVSNNSAHTDLVETGLCIGIDTEKMEPAFYASHENMVCGLQSVPSQKKIEEALIDAFANYRNKISLSASQRKYAEKFSIQSLAPLYRSLVDPKQVFFGEKNAITKDYVLTNNTALYEKLNVLKSTRKTQISASSRHGIVIVGHDGGFFSVFNTFISYLVWNVGRTNIDYVIPDWRVDRILSYRKQDKFTSFCYGKRSDGNLWLQFFEALPNDKYGRNSYDDDQLLSHKSVIYDSFNEVNEPLLTYTNAYQLYKRNDFAEWRQWYHLYLDKYVKLKENIQAQIDEVFENSFRNCFVIGAHVRHPSHGIEQPGASIPTTRLFQSKIIARARGIDNYKVFLATDQQSVVDEFVQLFGDRLIVRGDVARVSQDDDAKFSKLSAADQMKEGHQIQHLTASDEARWSKDMAEEVIVDAYLLAKCDVFIHITSNIATAVSFINPDVEMIYCE